MTDDRADYIVLHDRGSGENLMLIGKSFFDTFAIFTDESKTMVKISSKAQHNCCKSTDSAFAKCVCQRLDSILCYSTLNHAKSSLSYGDFENVNIVGMYLFDGLE
jgi:hypothetical protein